MIYGYAAGVAFPLCVACVSQSGLERLADWLDRRAVHLHMKSSRGRRSGHVRDESTRPHTMSMKSDLTRFLSELQQKALQRDYVFRGERMARGRGGHVPVTSSLYRWVQAYRRSLDHFAPLQETETRLLVDLQDKIADEINRMLPEPYPATDRLKLLARVQHFHGLTNLIDFTRDCLVALFFACYDREGEESGGGWTGGDGRIVFLPETGATIVDAPIGDSRAIAQRSVFCEESCGVLPEDSYEILYVSGSLKRQLLMYLARCHGICADTLFPDFAAAVRHVSSDATLEALWDEVSITNRPC